MIEPESTSEPQPRKRKTQAEKDAKSARPLDPQSWYFLGGLLLFLGICIYFDPLGFSNAGEQRGEAWLQLILVIAIACVGKNPIAVVLTVLGLLSLGRGKYVELHKQPGTDENLPPAA